VEQAFDRTRSPGRAYAASWSNRVAGRGRKVQPEGWWGRVAPIARAHGALLIADEVMTGFGRTGAGPGRRPVLFATHREGVQPDFLCLAKGLTGGYLPMAATLTTQSVFDAFLGEYGEFRTFFHGHSYTANQLGAAAARESRVAVDDDGTEARSSRRRCARRSPIRKLSAVGDIRQVGLVADRTVRDWRTRAPFDLRE
jgi:adenosylmethionine-8-amino-7-oxononanoate aminotransferase